ncbi:MAG TPA: helix-turn-helix domain-containing protein, partial [Acidobacteriota bacterium]
VLIHYFVEKVCTKNEMPVKRVSYEAMKILQDYDWPGNVRELENIIERIVILTAETNIEPKHLPATIMGVTMPLQAEVNGGSLHDKVSSIESFLIRQSLEENNWNVSNTARALGLTRQGLQKKIRKYALKKAHPAVVQ